MLKKLEFDGQIFFRVLTEIVDQFGGFARELVNVRGGLVDVIEQRFVSEDLAQCALAGTSVAEDKIELFGRSVEAGECVTGLIV